MQRAWVEGWGTGTIASAVQPGTSTHCDSSHQCEIGIVGSGETTPSFGDEHRIGGFDLQADLIVDYPDGSPNGFGGQCSPVGGSLSLQQATKKAGSMTLVVKIQGQDCAVGSSATLSAITATYLVDGIDSTGKYTGASGTGNVSASVDASATSTGVEFAFSGSLQTAHE